MVYIFLNTLAIAILCFMIYQYDRNVRTATVEISSLMISLLLLTIKSILFTIALIFREIWSFSMMNLFLKFMFMVEGAFFVCFFYALISIGLNRKSTVLTVLKTLSYIFIIFYVGHFFDGIDISITNGLHIGSDYIFNETVTEFFPWTWVTIYNYLCRVILPTVGCLVMLLLREKNATPLLKYQGIRFMEALVISWIVYYFIQYMAAVNPAFPLLYIYSYVILYALLYFALLEKSVPSGRGLIVTLVKALFAYLIPGLLLGTLLCFAQPNNSNTKVAFVILVVVSSIGAVLLGWKIYDFIMFGTRITTADYERNFERDLGTINYNLEMDQVTKHMFDVFRNNVECSTLNVFIDDGHGSLTTAYSSNNFEYKMPISSSVFDHLLNENINVVIYNDISDAHEYDIIREDLMKLFDDLKCDALFVLNEGHNIIGIIILGKKVSGDHYKDYDKAIFHKLYSYFFVFGYYMRNISNKDILGTVSREIKMSSQIITSIQENIDHIKNNKVDLGYLMVPAHNIGGEFIDLIRLTDTRHLIVVGDLSGKGIAASMNMVILKSIIRTYLAETHDFKKLVAKINVFIRESLQKGTIFQGLFALVDFESDTMYYINCGIPALFLYAQVYNNVIEIQGSGHVLGFVKDITPYLSVKTTKLNRGDILLCCTDGLINSHSLRGEKFGKERVTQAILSNSIYPAQRMAQFTMEGLVKFMSKEMEDDVSILVMKYKTSAEFAPEETVPAEPEESVEETAVTDSSESVTVDEMEQGNVAEADTNENHIVEESAVETEESEKQVESSEASIFEINDLTFSGSDVPEEPDSDQMFREDITSDEKKKNDGEIDFDPTAFGLPADFQL